MRYLAEFLCQVSGTLYFRKLTKYRIMFGMIFILKRRYSDLGKVNDKHEMRNSKQLDTLSDYDKVMFFSVK